jgi:hypothetical protein
MKFRGPVWARRGLARQADSSLIAEGRRCELGACHLPGPKRVQLRPSPVHEYARNPRELGNGTASGQPLSVRMSANAYEVTYSACRDQPRRIRPTLLVADDGTQESCADGSASRGTPAMQAHFGRSKDFTRIWISGGLEFIESIRQCCEEP